MVGIRERVALNIRKIRKSNGLSQEKLADLCGLHRTYVGSVERSERNITIENLDRIAHALGVDARDLIE
ncbi:helix-turn-helix domain-containing protein [Litoreibacter halocynthiae]|uniref:helix-turn-helix domain-containing protein n=1 Tax=Litoreibacter halocynthiae TaxID=1242689 RepID=UPI002490D8FB|nr:helix-turn-helix transcriptional regulator [Litoreibacter halocynthiae]